LLLLLLLLLNLWLKPFVSMGYVDHPSDMRGRFACGDVLS
jgi:hypothetical protein